MEMNQFMCGVNLREFLAESNRIEGILKPPGDLVYRWCESFLVDVSTAVVEQVEHACHLFQPNAKLRDRAGLNVRVGSRHPPPGGPHIREALRELLEKIDDGELSPWEAHVAYETLHPFTDGNGRTGRLLWLWQMEQCGDRMASLGFLHAFYYQTLAHLNRTIENTWPLNVDHRHRGER